MKLTPLFYAQLLSNSFQGFLRQGSENQKSIGDLQASCAYYKTQTRTCTMYQDFQLFSCNRNIDFCLLVLA